MRNRLVCWVAAPLIWAALPAAAADAQQSVRCKSADLRYPFEEGGPNTFGVFKLRITRGSCTTARRVARAWMKEFEANLEEGRVELPEEVRGFKFKELPPNAAQTYRLRGRRGAKSIRFDYVVPNG